MANFGIRRVAILGYPGVHALDVIGPMEVFDSANIGETGPLGRYEIRLVGLTRRPFSTSSGLVLTPGATIADRIAYDTVIIPGGAGMFKAPLVATAAQWIRSQAAQTRRIVSICTGVFGLAESGLLAGRRVTTHWRFAAKLARAHPSLDVDPNSLFLKDDKFYTSAGVTAGIDLTLALVEEDFGPQIALEVARDLVVFLKRPGGQDQFSEPLRFQIQSSDRFDDIAAWIASNLHKDLSVEALAGRAAICPRHFRRRFKRTFGQGPAEFVEGLRLGEARRRLTCSVQPLKTIARSVGFSDAGSLSRVFRRRFGVAPSDYRSRFCSSAGPAGASVRPRNLGTRDGDELRRSPSKTCIHRSI